MTRGMFFRQSLKAHADAMELIDFVQDGFKRHGYTPLSHKKPKMGGLQMDWHRSET
jgi:hypothetical protein